MLNLNIGVLGHVDSGKTSLSKRLSEIASTAAFDKNPQSQERGITLDLGFSSFYLDTPPHLFHLDENKIQYTLVDCPGHASLLKTVIGGTQITDMFLLVVDIMKGFQTQTAECLILGEITNKKLIIVLNKIDLIEDSKRDITIQKMRIKIMKTLKTTTYSESDVHVVPVSATSTKNFGIDELFKAISEISFVPKRSAEGPFVFAVDHCFRIKGQGTIMTGTILSGSLRNNDIVYLSGSTEKKVKSMQIFRKPVSYAKQGDRLGICVTQFDSNLLERGLVCSQDAGRFIKYCIVDGNFIKHFKYPLESKSKCHISIGYETTLAKIIFFSSSENVFDTSPSKFFDHEFKYLEKINIEDQIPHIFILIEFEKVVFVIDNSLVVGAKLDADITANLCRLAFWGYMKFAAAEKDVSEFLDMLKIYKMKSKCGVIDRVENSKSLIVKNMFKKETDLQKFFKLKIRLANGQTGRIESNFGTTGKVRITLNEEIQLTENKAEVFLDFKRFLFDSKKKIHQ